MIVSPASTGSVQSHTSPVSSLAAVFVQRVEILVVVHPVDLVVCDLGDMLDISGQPPTVLVIIPEVVPVSTAPGTVVSLPDKPHSVTPVVVTPMGNLTNVHVRTLLRIVSGVEARMLIKSNRVLLPGLVSQDEVDGDVLPVIIVSMIHSEGITASLEAVPEVPGQFEEISTADYLVVDRSRGVEPGTAPVVTVGGLVRIAVVLG